MKPKLYGIVFLVNIIFIVVLTSCQKKEEYPVIPEIELKQCVVVDEEDKLGNIETKCLLTFYVVYGDGDVGLKQPNLSEIPPIDSTNYNLFLKLYEKKDGVYSLVELNSPLVFRIPYIELPVKNSYLKADIDIQFDLPITLIETDTLTFSFYIFDRSYNKSNILTLPDIPSDFNGLVFQKID